jgi:hypothetical protein
MADHSARTKTALEDSGMELYHAAIEKTHKICKI